MQASVDDNEIAKFEAMASEWWDPHGKFRPLHRLQPCRLGFVTGEIAAEFGRDLNAEKPFEGLSVLDIGCGGGLIAEPLARLGAAVTAIDPGRANVEAARLHAAQSGLEIDYQVTTAETLAETGTAFDVITNLEVVEHVEDPGAFLAVGAGMLRPGGLMLTSTLNRNAKSFALAIVGAEYVLRWLPKGTHQWSKFITPEELAAMLGKAGLSVVDRKGFVFNPLTQSWRISERDLSVNYAMAARKPG